MPMTMARLRVKPGGELSESGRPIHVHPGPRGSPASRGPILSVKRWPISPRNGSPGSRTLSGGGLHGRVHLLAERLPTLLELVLLFRGEPAPIGLALRARLL